MLEGFIEVNLWKVVETEGAIAYPYFLPVNDLKSGIFPSELS